MITPNGPEMLEPKPLRATTSPAESTSMGAPPVPETELSNPKSAVAVPAIGATESNAATKSTDAPLPNILVLPNTAQLYIGVFKVNDACVDRTRSLSGGDNGRSLQVRLSSSAEVPLFVQSAIALAGSRSGLREV